MKKLSLLLLGALFFGGLSAGQKPSRKQKPTTRNCTQIPLQIKNEKLTTIYELTINHHFTYLNQKKEISGAETLLIFTKNYSSFEEAKTKIHEQITNDMNFSNNEQELLQKKHKIELSKKFTYKISDGDLDDEKQTITKLIAVIKEKNNN